MTQQGVSPQTFALGDDIPIGDGFLRLSMFEAGDSPIDVTVGNECEDCSICIAIQDAAGKSWGVHSVDAKSTDDDLFSDGLPAGSYRVMVSREVLLSKTEVELVHGDLSKGTDQNDGNYLFEDTPSVFALVIAEDGSATLEPVVADEVKT